MSNHQVLEPRDGPTAAFKQHHDVTYRKTVAGHRTYSRAEQMMDADEITPAGLAACLRYRRNYERGVIGSSRILTFNEGGRGGGTGHLSEERLDRTRSHREAAAALDGRTTYLAVGPSPAETMILFCVEDMSFRQLGRWLGQTDKQAKRAVVRFIAVLVDHYAQEDCIIGRSTTPTTKVAARRMLDPDDRPPVLSDRDERRRS